MSYTLSARQVRAFSDRVDLYRPVNQVSTAADILAGTDKPQEAQKAYSLVRCRIQMAKEGSIPLPIGRSNYDVLDTTDLLRVHMSQEVGDGWFVKLRTKGHPEEDGWFVVQGDAQAHAFRAAEKKLYIKRATKPPLGAE
jgi:hypothetical protein